MMCLRFFNSDMYFNDDELEKLLDGLSGSEIDDREAFFAECLRLRRRQRNLWADTPLAKVRPKWRETCGFVWSHQAPALLVFW